MTTQTPMNTTISKALTWSGLHDGPVLAHVAEVDEYAVAWCGVLTSLPNAMLAASSNWFYNPISPSQKFAAYNSFKRIVASGAFGDVNWTELRYMEYHTKISSLLNLSGALKNRRDPITFFRIFDIENAIKDQDDN